MLQVGRFQRAEGKSPSSLPVDAQILSIIEAGGIFRLFRERGVDAFRPVR